MSHSLLHLETPTVEVIKRMYSDSVLSDSQNGLFIYDPTSVWATILMCAHKVLLMIDPSRKVIFIDWSNIKTWKLEWMVRHSIAKALWISNDDTPSIYDMLRKEARATTLVVDSALPILMSPDSESDMLGLKSARDQLMHEKNSLKIVMSVSDKSFAKNALDRNTHAFYGSSIQDIFTRSKLWRIESERTIVLQNKLRLLYSTDREVLERCLQSQGLYWGMDNSSAIQKSINKLTALPLPLLYKIGRWKYVVPSYVKNIPSN